MNAKFKNEKKKILLTKKKTCTLINTREML